MPGSPFWSYFLVALASAAVGWMASMAFFRWRRGTAGLGVEGCQAWCLHVAGSFMVQDSRLGRAMAFFMRLAWEGLQFYVEVSGTTALPITNNSQTEFYVWR